MRRLLGSLWGDGGESEAVANSDRVRSDETAAEGQDEHLGREHSERETKGRENGDPSQRLAGPEASNNHAMDPAVASERTSASSNHANPGDDENDLPTQTEESDEFDDSFPKARDFLADDAVLAKIINSPRESDEDDDVDADALAERATELLAGFHDDHDRGDDDDDARTAVTCRTVATRVKPVSAAFRTAYEEDAKKKKKHVHQSIFDVLDKNFKELGDGVGGRSGEKDAKLCFVAFVAIFSLPSKPVFAEN